MRMGNIRLERWLGEVVLFMIMLLSSLVSCAILPQTDLTYISETGISGDQRRGIRQDDHALPERRRSDLDVSSSQVNGTTEAELLLEFRKGVTEDPLNVLSNWNSNNYSNYCNWTGVQCSSPLGPVISLNLSGYGLGGSIFPSLGSLQFLESLDLSNNFFEGTIPATIANCSFLTLLDLSVNGVGGSIPPELATLSKLETLNFSRNLLTGVFPSSLSNLSALTYLSVRYNQLFGDIISVAWGGFGKLETLHLLNNHFSGAIPESLINCSHLQELALDGNSFTGSIPRSLGGLTALRNLYLHNNLLSGAIPESLTNCSNLQNLWLENNTFTGSIPRSLGALKALTYLRLDSNRLSGAIPESLGTLKALIHLKLFNNQLFGAIPESLSNCSNLQELSLGSNLFTGSIPLSLGALKALRKLDLDSNLLSGEIPEELGNLDNLTLLFLSNNTLGGSIPVSLLHCSSLKALLLYDNQLTGGVPANIGMLSQLQDIYLWGNSLTGAIPASLLNCTSLIEIDLRNNFFNGNIPQGLGILSEMELLYLQANNFGGQIPVSLGNSSKLQEVRLDNNRLIGEIPPQLGLLKNLSLLDLSSNFLTGQIPASLGSSIALLSLFLGNNHLTGTIPPSIGELTNLQGLNLSGNVLAGGIPPELSKCAQLYMLDLSGNLLTGNIADELGNLTRLNLLYLNNNNFTGSILPALRQTSTSLLEINLANNSLGGVVAGYDFSGLRNLRIGLDISNNLFTGPIPSGIGALQFVQRINFSFNAFSGAIPVDFSQCTGLESLDLSSNNLDAQIPESLTALHLTYFNVSYNQLTGSVPSQFDNFSDGSFLGNPNLCGPMLLNKCGSKCHGIHCHRLWIVIIPAVAAGIAGALVVAGIWFLFIAKTGDSSGMVAPALPNASHFTSEFENLSMGDILAATNGFSDGSIMGVGAKSTVFAGVLPSGVMIAVKRLELRNDDKATGQLYRELQRLSKVEHINLLKVHGMFTSGDLKVLVLEYMPSGSLHKQLYDGESCRLTWAQRLHIALGVAEAMVHLHHAGSKPIVHQDLKPSNILLDVSMEPKVGDYGISRFVNHENHGDTTVSSNLYGTIGYIPPEYGALRSVSTMGDVYNFGVVLMQLFTRKQPTDDMFGQEMSLRSWVVDAFPSRISQILDPTLRQELDGNEQDVGIHLMVRLAIACTRNVPKERPTMIQARDMLMEIKSIELPDKSGQ